MLLRTATGVALICVTAACSTTPPAPDPVLAPAVIHVPGDAPTIQAAVDRAGPGDLVLVAPGTYRESVRITRPRVVLRGADRNGVVIDGELTRNNGIVVTATGVAVENLTVRRFRFNGVLVTGAADHQGADYERLDVGRFPPVSDFRVSYVTAYNNALYGIYAFDARRGVIEHTYTSGHADAGIYVGQCRSCEIVVRDNVAERNAIGYEATNASGPLHVVRNVFRHNRVGLTTGSDPLEALSPQTGATIAGNLITDNNEAATPEQADGGFGIGIGIGGGTRNLILRNRVSGNHRAGVLVADQEGFVPTGNRVTANAVSGNGADLVFAPADPTLAMGNCFSATAGECRPLPATEVPVAPPAPPGIAYSEVAPPGPQPQQPARPATPAGGPPRVDMDRVTLPREAGR